MTVCIFSSHWFLFLSLFTSLYCFFSYVYADFIDVSYTYIYIYISFNKSFNCKYTLKPRFRNNEVLKEHICIKTKIDLGRAVKKYKKPKALWYIIPRTCESPNPFHRPLLSNPPRSLLSIDLPLLLSLPWSPPISASPELRHRSPPIPDL